MSSYSPQDFAKHPAKYRLFQTATIAKNIFTHNGENDLREGEIVGIEYFTTARNTLFKRDEPVYIIKGKDHTLYANCLKDFIL